MIVSLVLTNARVLLTVLQAQINWITGSDYALDSSLALSTNQNLRSMHPIMATLVSMVTAACVQ